MTYIATWILVGLLGIFIKWGGDFLIDYKWDKWDLVVNLIGGIIGGVIWFFLCIIHFIQRHQQYTHMCSRNLL